MLFRSNDNVTVNLNGALNVGGSDTGGDGYFALNRLQEGASKERAMEALIVALAVVMKDAAKAESEKRGVTTIEFGLLRQALAVVIEVFTETETITE